MDPLRIQRCWGWASQGLHMLKRKLPSRPEYSLMSKARDTMTSGNQNRIHFKYHAGKDDGRLKVKTWHATVLVFCKILFPVHRASHSETSPCIITKCSFSTIQVCCFPVRLLYWFSIPDSLYDLTSSQRGTTRRQQLLVTCPVHIVLSLITCYAKKGLQTYWNTLV